jgi:drug/metabolite transporter (DMT)-like permease
MSPDYIRSPLRGASYALLGAVFFAINGSVAKVVIEAGFSPVQVTVMRSVMTAILAGAWLAITDRTHFRITRREVGGFALLGIGGLAMLQWLYAAAISMLPVGVALLIEYTAVIMVALTAWLVFKERVHPKLWVAIGSVLVGLAIVSQIWDSHLRPLGALCAFGGAAAYAFYFLAGERLVAKRPPMAVVFWAALFASAFWLAFSGWWTIDPQLFGARVSLTGSLDAVHVPLWVPLAWVLTLGSFAPFIFSFAALRHLQATAVGILASSEVLFAFAVAWVWLRETLTALQMAGAALVFVGIVVAQTARHTPAHGTLAPAEVP